MQFPQLFPGRFLRRDNRFRASITVNGQATTAHVPNSGRLTELFSPDCSIWVSPATNSQRKTPFDLKLVAYQGVLVSVDARLPNKLFEEAAAPGRLAGFDFPLLQREVAFGRSRLDFKLSGPRGLCWVEVKSVTLVEARVARFPDAPTSRGRRHLLELIDACRQGDRAAVVFVVQRPDADQFEPHREADPAFAQALLEAANAGVKLKAYRCDVSLSSIAIAEEIPVCID